MQHAVLKMINTDKLADIAGGRYALTALVAKRLREVNAGAPLLVEKEEGERTIDAVCREIEERKVWLESFDVSDYDQSLNVSEDIGDLLDLD